MLFNQYTVAGNLGRTPEMSYTPNGKAVTKFSIAVYQGKDAKGDTLPAMWLNIVTWNDLAEKLNGTLKKGDEVLLVGRLSMRPYTDKNQVARQALEVTASTVQRIPREQRVETGSVNENDALGDLEDHPF